MHSKKKKKKKKMVIHRNNQIQYRFLLLKRPELHNSPVLKNQNTASLPNVHTCNNVIVPGGIARGENGIRYPNVTDPSKYTISNDFIFYIE
jgi:hypothetical protein